MTLEEQNVMHEMNAAIWKINKFYNDWAARRNEKYYVSCVFYMLRVRKLKYQNELVELYGAPKQTISAVIAELERTGYVELEIDPKDRRRKIIRLTEKGCEYADTVSYHLHACEEEALHQMNLDDLKQMTKWMDEFGGYLAQSLEKHVMDGIDEVGKLDIYS